MAVNSQVLCDCCGAALADASVVNAYTLMYVAEGGGVITVLYCIENGCGPSLVAKAAAQREKDHTRMEHAVDKIPAAHGHLTEDLQKARPKKK